MDLAGGLRRFGAAADRPGAHLVAARRQEGDETQQLIGRLNETLQSGFGHAELFHEHGALLLIQLRDLLLKPGAHRQHAAALGVRERLDLLIVGVVLRPGGEAVLVEIRGIDDGLVGEKVGRGDNLALLLVGLKAAGGTSAVHPLDEAAEDLCFLFEFLVAALGVFLRLVLAAAEHFDVGEDELEIDGLNVAHGVVRALVADDVGIIKAADDVNDGVRVADVAEKLVAETFALRRALDKTRDIHELDRGGGVFLRLVHLREIVQPRVRHSDNADVRLDRAERVVRRLRPGVRQRIEKRALAHVGQTHDT